MLLLPALGAWQSAAPDLARPQDHVDDVAKVLGVERERTLNGLLQELQQKTGVQYIILTVNSTGGLPIKQFSIELLDKWQLGSKGVLFTLAVDDRAYRFEVGDGLKGILTDQFLGEIGRNLLVPYLREGRDSDGVFEGNLRVIRRLADSYGVVLTGMPELREHARPGEPPGIVPCFTCPCCSALLFLFLIAVLAGSFRRGRLWPWLLLPLFFRGFGGYGSRGRSGAYGGGPFGGAFGGFGGGLPGGFGHFSGREGGRFGGGGAGGRW